MSVDYDTMVERETRHRLPRVLINNRLSSTILMMISICVCVCVDSFESHFIAVRVRDKLDKRAPVILGAKPQKIITFFLFLYYMAYN